MGTPGDTQTTHPESVVNVTTDREAHPKHWIAILVHMCMEKRVSERLNKLGIETYVASQQEIHLWSDRKKKVDRIVIPMVVFVHTDSSTERRLRTYSFVRKVISYPGQYVSAVIPDSQIDRLKYMLRHSESTVELKDRILEVGDTVRIARGPLKDLEGELCFVSSGKPMVAVRIGCLGYACVNINRSDVVTVASQ